MAKQQNNEIDTKGTIIHNNCILLCQKKQMKFQNEQRKDDPKRRIKQELVWKIKLPRTVFNTNLTK